MNNIQVIWLCLAIIYAGILSKTTVNMDVDAIAESIIQQVRDGRTND